MKLYFKERFFSWFDSYDVYNEDGSPIFTVKGELSWGHCLRIYDASENIIGTVKERVLTFLPKFEMYLGESYIGEIKKEFTFFHPKFTLDMNGWEVDGDFFDWNYTVTDNAGRTIMQAEKKLFHMSDTYEIDVYKQEDVLLSLMIVVAIDAAKCSAKD